MAAGEPRFAHPVCSLRVFGRAAAILGMLLCSAVQAQTMGVFPYRWNDGPPADAITPADIREALVWTGHLDFFFKGELSAVARPQQKAKAAKPSPIDDSGKTGALKLETRDGADLRADEVFDKASGAVYVVNADRRLGSAVAISDNELLTSCHVTGDLAEVKIARAKDEMPAKVISRNVDADRCVLRTDTKLAKWVTVRPYDDIKVGERAITIGTPQGLELTAAEGIVSSKRVYNQTRVVQTSAPISQGSSGGGLFDARGHLLGITTFYFRGGQNLNFAVAAEEYAQEREESANR